MKKTHLALTLLLLTIGLVACTEKPNSPSSHNGESSSDIATIGFDENGASIAIFSVGEERYVRFSRGNLQYKPITSTWKFANTQYEYIGEADTNTSELYNDWIDLFGWGTSGYDNGAVAFKPTSISTEFADYYPGGENPTNDLTGDYARCDWGVYNSISNGGNTAAIWRTLTTTEWCYLLSYGQQANIYRTGKWGIGTIAGQHHGLILLPDVWTLPDGVTFVSGIASGWNTNIYGIEQWILMEKAGAVFLPAAGRRNGNTVSFVGYYGDYWSTTHYNAEKAYTLSFGNKFLDADRTTPRNQGCSVRLVMDIDNNTKQ